MVLEPDPYNNTSMCDVPEQIRPLADALCLNVLRKPCPKLPCKAVYHSTATNKRIENLANGRVINDKKSNNSTNSSEVQRVECIRSPALELFNGPSNPSLRTTGYFHITKELVSGVLSQSYHSSESVWGLSLIGESIGYYPWCGVKSRLSFFDITQGYDRQLYDVVSLKFLLPEEHFLTGDARVSFDTAILEKQNPPSYVTAPIVWMNSNCNTPSKRSQYMKTFMSYILVDAWGDCSRNKGPVLPPEIANIQKTNPNISHFQGNWEMAKKAMIKHYTFTMAYENTFEHDYVTEKLWQPLVAGSVPLYYGAPNIDDWLPCENCIINLRKFPNPEAAAAFITSVAANKTAYAQYHKWREQPVLPKFQRILNYSQRTNDYTLDSIMCAMAHSKNPQIKRYEILDDIGPIFSSYE